MYQKIDIGKKIYFPGGSVLHVPAIFVVVVGSAQVGDVALYLSSFGSLFLVDFFPDHLIL